MDKLALLKQNNNIVDVAVSLGFQAVGGKAIRCFNTGAHKNGDKRASFVFQTQVSRFICYACGIKGDVIDFIKLYKGCEFVEAVKYLDPNFYDKEDSPPKLEKIVAPEEYLHSRGLTVQTIEKFGLKLVKHLNLDAIEIPLSTGKRYRMLQGNTKYLYETGTKVCLLKTIDKASSVVITEGEFDAFMVYQETGMAAWTSTSGVKSFEASWKQDFEGVGKIYIAFDNDEAGRSSIEDVASKLGIERCYRLEVPRNYGKDWTDFFLNGGTKSEFEELLKSATPLKQNLASKFLALQENASRVVQKIATGYKVLDSVLDGGLRTGNAYLFAGLKESGKTAYSLTIVSSMLLDSVKIGYIDTELGIGDISKRLAAIYNHITYKEAEQKPELVREWVELFQENFFYSGIDGDGELTRDGKLDFDLAWSQMERFVKDGAKVIVFDNVTSYSSSGSSDKKQEWQILNSCILRLVNFAKIHRVVLIFILHTKPSTVFLETPKGMYNLLKQDRAEDIFEESLSISRKPTLSDVYGGGMSQSQISGAFLIWRPFQKFDKPELNSMAQMVMESLRHGAKQNITLTFHGAKSTFTENDSAVLIPEKPVVIEQEEEMEEQEVMPL